MTRKDPACSDWIFCGLNTRLSQLLESHDDFRMYSSVWKIELLPSISCKNILIYCELWITKRALVQESDSFVDLHNAPDVTQYDSQTVHPRHTTCTKTADMSNLPWAWPFDEIAHLNLRLRWLPTFSPISPIWCGQFGANRMKADNSEVSLPSWW